MDLLFSAPSEGLSGKLLCYLVGLWPAGLDLVYDELRNDVLRDLVQFAAKKFGALNCFAFVRIYSLVVVCC